MKEYCEERFENGCRVMEFSEIKPYIDRMCQAERQNAMLINAYTNYKKALDSSKRNYWSITRAYFTAIELILGEEK